MRTLALPWSIAALCLGAAALAHGGSDTIDVGSIRPGMKGYGLSVFRGQAPERFEVEVIDVLRNFRPDQDLILVRTQHPLLDKAIVVGGMSGSPIYLEGKLAGAYAYGWSFGKEPVVGVTPIANMLAELGRPEAAPLHRALAALPDPAREKRLARREPRLTGLTPYLGLEHRDPLEPLREHARAHGYAAAAHEGFAAATTPIMLAGLDERVAHALNTELERFGLVALQAGGSAPRGAAPGQAGSAPARGYADGAALGVALIQGDISATAIGTVTHVVGDKLVAFGHPMMNAGQPRFPTCTARVLHILASQARSFKIAEAGPALGTLVHDRQSAIVVDTKAAADTIPVRLRVAGIQGAPRSEWNMAIASERSVTPMLAFAALGNAISATAAERSDVTFTAHSRVAVEGHGVLEVHDVAYAPLGLDGPIGVGGLRLFDLIEAAYGNPFEQPRVERIDIDLDVRFARDVIAILDALVPANEVDPDRDLNVYLTLQRFGAPPETRIVSLHVPASAAGEKIELAFEAGSSVQPERPEPANLDQIFDNVRLGYATTSLVVSIKLPSQGLKLRGHVVRNLPGSALDMLQLQAEGSRPNAFVTIAREERPLGHVVTGSARVSLEVRREALR